MGVDLDAETLEAMSDRILRTHPATQAIYLYGSHATGDVHPDSDVDLALLLPHVEAKATGSLALSELRTDLERLLGCQVDLVNLRQSSTVFQKEVVFRGRRIYCAAPAAVAEFEMLVLSFYQKLNEERREILKAFLETGRAYPV
jgi:uncharacterized protein